MKTLITGLATFVLGIGMTALVIVNPFRWTWMERFQLSTADSMSEMGELRASDGDGTSPNRKVKYWKAPMDPTYVRDQPGKSPMGMDLVPVYEDEVEQPLGPGAVRIDPVFVQNIGVQTETVRRMDLPFTIRTVGVLGYDAKQMVWVNTKYEGWIDTVYVNYVGESVEKGQKLFEIYSPQLVTTQKEYLQALDYAERMDGSDYPEIAKRARALVTASRERLAYWDVSTEQIQSLGSTRQILRTLAVTAPASGVVVEKMDHALEGMFAKAGMNLYKIANLSTIWLEADIYEHQVPWLRVGTYAKVELPHEPGKIYRGRIRYLLPFFDEKTRTMKVSIELQNPGGSLRADMYANVTFDVPAARNVLAVPEEAVIHSGERNILVLDRGEGKFEVRDVTLGVNGGGLWEVTEGLNDGDRVVVSSQFLIDSESNLKEAIRKLIDRGDEPARQDTEDADPPGAENRDHH